MEGVLSYWLGQGYFLSPLAGFVYLLAAVCLALNMKKPEK
jgi:hypothetical protein